MKRYLLALVFGFSTLAVMAQTPSRFEEKPKEEEAKPEETKPKEESLPKASYKSRATTQKKSNDDFFDRLRYGGMIGLQFGSYTAIDLQPRIYYMLNEKTALGVGGTYSYYRYSDSYPNPYLRGYSNEVYGYNLLSWYEPIAPLILQAEFEQLNWASTVIYDPTTGETTERRTWSTNMFLGGGIRQSGGGRGSFFLLFLYNLTYDPNLTYYSQPYVIRVGFAL